MRIVLGMAGSTILGCADEELIGMTLAACSCRMFADQGEGRLVVIERGRRPSGRRMTGGTVRAELAAVRIVLEVT